MTKPLSPSSPHAKSLHDYLDNHWALNGGDLGLPKADYDKTPVLSVPCIPSDTGKPLQCWFNVDEDVRAGKGSAVFGWALWHAPWADHYFAQPHAVLRASGELVCITPPEPGMEELEHLTFFADPRIPFDYKQLRVPMMLCYNDGDSIGDFGPFRWLDFSHKPLHVDGAWSTERPDNFNMGSMLEANLADDC